MQGNRCNLQIGITCCTCSWSYSLCHGQSLGRSRTAPQRFAFRVCIVKINITIAPDQMRYAWVVYLLRDAGGNLQFIGCSRLSQVFNIPDARANSYFLQIFPNGSVMNLEVLHMEPSREKARNAQWFYFRQYGKPFIQQAGRAYRGTKKQPILCDQTGEKFESISDASKAHGVAQSQLSNHLMGKSGFITVHGKTYRYST